VFWCTNKPGQRGRILNLRRLHNRHLYVHKYDISDVSWKQCYMQLFRSVYKGRKYSPSSLQVFIHAPLHPGEIRHSRGDEVSKPKGPNIDARWYYWNNCYDNQLIKLRVVFQYTGCHYQESSSNRIEITNAAIFLINFEYKMNIRLLQVCITFVMCDQLCDVISCYVWSCDMGKINVGLYDKIVR